MVAGADNGNPLPSDAELLEAARLGSVRGFERLVERHYGTIYAVAYARTGHRETAEDLAQEVFLRAWLCLKDLRESGRFIPWLVRIAHNLATNWQRRQRLVPMVSGSAEDAVEKVPDNFTPNARQTAEENEQERAVREAILLLPPEQREVILLHYMEDLNQREIAQRLDTHPVTVHRLLQRGLKGMKKSLEPLIRETVPALRAPRRAVASTVAVIAATTALSATSKSALAVAEAGVAKAASVSLGVGAAGATGSATSTSFFGLLKTIFASLATGAKIMGTGKAIGMLAAVAAIAGGGVYYYSDSQAAGSMKDNGSAIWQPADTSQELPREVLARIIAIHKEERANLDPTGRLPACTHIYAFFSPDNNHLLALIPHKPDRVLNPGDELDMGGSTGKISAVFSETGEALNFRQDRIPKTSVPEYYHNILSIDKTWPAGEERILVWSNPWSARDPKLATSVEQNGYTVGIGNDLGPEGIQQFYLVLPPQYRFESASEKPDFEEKISNYMVHGWRKHTAQNENVRIRALIKPNEAASDASSSASGSQTEVTPEETKEIKAAFGNYQDAVKQGDQQRIEGAWDWEAVAQHKQMDIATAKQKVGFPDPPAGLSNYSIDSIVSSGEELEGYRKINSWLPVGKIARVTSGSWDWYLRQTPTGWKFVIQETTNFRSNYRR